jgi:hypothetical protein
VSVSTAKGRIVVAVARAEIRPPAFDDGDGVQAQWQLRDLA